MSKQENAVTVIQKWVRRFLVQKGFIRITKVSEAISNHQKLVKRQQISPTTKFPFAKAHEIMITRINVQGCDIKLVSNQGTPDTMRKYLAQSEATKSAAVINGGYYAINGFYELPTNSAIGLHRYAANYISGNKRNNVVRRDVDNTKKYFEHESDEVSSEFEDYEDKPIESRLHLKTQTPYDVCDQYGFFRMTHQGTVDIRRTSEFDDASFKLYIENAKNLLSSGPMLVYKGKTVFTDEMLKDPRYQFEQVKAYFGKHPGSVPPGTFYHADQPNPRSAIGLTANGDLLFVTVKGEEEPDKRDGLTLPQFAELMKDLGALTALNLDGGYSACQGVFNESMLTPLFMKKAGRDKLIPCAIMAVQRQESPNEPRSTKTISA